jgi:hypothetical protein
MQFRLLILCGTLFWGVLSVPHLHAEYTETCMANESFGFFKHWLTSRSPDRISDMINGQLIGIQSMTAKPADDEAFKQLIAVFKGYYDDQVSQGRLPMIVLHEVIAAVQMLIGNLNTEVTRDHFRTALREGAEFLHIKDWENEEDKRLSIGHLISRFTHPDITRMLSRFRKTDTPIVVASLRSYFHIYFNDGWKKKMHANPHLRPSVERARELAIPTGRMILMSAAAYAPYRGGHAVIHPGFKVPMALVDLGSIHEMQHTVQTHFWDVELALRFFSEQVWPQINAKSDLPLHLSLDQTRIKYIEKTADLIDDVPRADYYRTLLENLSSRLPSDLARLAFIDFFTYLRELDAFTLENSALLNLGRQNQGLNPHQQVLMNYAHPDLIDPFFLQYFNPDAVKTLLRDLNDKILD